MVKPRPRHAWRFALATGHMPERVRAAGRTYEHVRTFKHDFFAATGLYRCGEELAVLKVGRQAPVLGLPMAWVGRFLARREVAMYARAQGLVGVPALIGPALGTGFLHAFVPGHVLDHHERPSAEFFAQLAELLRALHARHMAYVDLNKPQNVLLGDDGRPYLFDFQIAVHSTARSGPARWLLRQLQQADWYHHRKHIKRLRPDLLTPAEAAAPLPLWIAAHRAVARPLIRLRRALTALIVRGHGTAVPGSGAK